MSDLRLLFATGCQRWWLPQRLTLRSIGEHQYRKSDLQFPGEVKHLETRLNRASNAPSCQALDPERHEKSSLRHDSPQLRQAAPAGKRLQRTKEISGYQRAAGGGADDVAGVVVNSGNGKLPS
jgi:hypothetical protein